MNLLKQKIKEAIENVYFEVPDDAALLKMLKVRYTKNLSAEVGQSISGISIDFELFDGESEEIPAIISGFSSNISDAAEDGIVHIVKFFDGELYDENARYAREIFNIEMKLREVFSIIFIETFEEDFYNLLKSVNVKPMETPQVSQMQARFENEFFYLTFSQYRNLNEKKPVGNIESIIRLISQAADFQAFQDYLAHSPIEKEEYADFILSLKASLEPIETVRNCVMHNRVISEREKSIYAQAKENLNNLIEEFLTSLQ